MDYFTLFGLEPSFNLDMTTLVSRYQEQQRQFHPDRFVACPEAERLQAMQQAVTINQAYQTLKQPLSRAEYLLSLQGINITSEQHTLRDTTFLMEQLTLREQLEQIGHAEQAEKELVDFIHQLESQLNHYQSEVQQKLMRQQWDEAADTVRKLRFLVKLRSQAEQLEERLLDL